MWWWQESTVLRPILFNSVLTDFAFITENGHQSSIYTINNGKHYKSVLLIGEPLTSMQLITLEKSTTNSELRVLQIGTTAKFKQQMHTIICKQHTRCNQNTFSHWTNYAVGAGISTLHLPTLPPLPAICRLWLHSIVSFHLIFWNS